MKVSIITVLSNSSNVIDYNLQSVKSQSYLNYEHIIIYHKTNQKFIEWIDHNFQNTRLLFSKNLNLFENLNKGIKQSTGDVIIFLDVNTYLSDIDSLKSIVNIFTSNNNIDGLCSSIIYLNNNSKLFHIYKIFNPKKFTKNWLMLGGIIPYTSLILKKEIFTKYGMFDHKFVLKADYDLTIRMGLNQDINILPIQNNFFYKFSNYKKKASLNINEIFFEYRLIWFKNNLRFGKFTLFLKYIKNTIHRIYIYFNPHWLAHIPPSHNKSSFLSNINLKIIKM
jgi:glycosyltransferase